MPFNQSSHTLWTLASPLCYTLDNSLPTITASRNILCKPPVRCRALQLEMLDSVFLQWAIDVFNLQSPRYGLHFFLFILHSTYLHSGSRHLVSCCDDGGAPSSYPSMLLPSITISETIDRYHLTPTVVFAMYPLNPVQPISVLASVPVSRNLEVHLNEISLGSVRSLSCFLPPQSRRLIFRSSYSIDAAFECLFVSSHPLPLRETKSLISSQMSPLSRLLESLASGDYSRYSTNIFSWRSGIRGQEGP
jgi:hypothetical protein